MLAVDCGMGVGDSVEDSDSGVANLKMLLRKSEMVMTGEFATL